MSAEKAQELGLSPLAEIVAYGMSSDRYPSLHTVPALALETALKKAGLAASDLGLVEINEAFAAVAVHATRMLGVDEDIVNVDRRCRRARTSDRRQRARGLVLTLAHGDAAPRRGPGGAAICGGGGQGDALVLQRSQSEQTTSGLAVGRLASAPARVAAARLLHPVVRLVLELSLTSSTGLHPLRRAPGRRAARVRSAGQEDLERGAPPSARRRPSPTRPAPRRAAAPWG